MIMTQQELRNSFELTGRLHRLRETRLGLDKLDISPDDLALMRCITSLDREITATEVLIEKRRGDIEETLALVEDIIDRTVLYLHFVYGLAWKEVGYFTNLTEGAAKSTSVRAMKKYIPK